MAITLRLVKGTELTFAEVDDNFKAMYYSSSVNGNILSLWKTGSGTADTINLSGASGTAFPFTGSGAISGTLIVEGPAGHITASGNVSASGGFSGSLHGTSSFAVTASHALNGGGNAFPFVGDAQITGSLTISGSFNAFTLDSDNIVLGSGSGLAMQAGADANVVIGTNTGTSLTTGDTNVLIGSDVGGTLDTEKNNIMIGYFTGRNSTGGDNNVYIGSEAGRYSNNAEYNVAVGYHALRGGIGNTGIFNTAIGYRAGTSIDNGGYNSFMGYDAGYNVDTGNKNVLLGYNSGYDIEGGEFNITIGENSGRSIVDGSHNISIGNAITFPSDVSKQLIIGSGSVATISASLETGDIIFASTASAEYLSTTAGNISSISASYAITASHALNAGSGGSAFPHSGSAQITGSLGLTGSADITGSVTSSENVLIGGGGLSIKNQGAQSYARFYCEVSNAHYTEIKAQPHALYSGNPVTLLPAYDLDFSKPFIQANITASGNISSSGGTVTAAVYTASTGFYANANAGFEFVAERDNQLNIKHTTANKHIFILTEGSGSINLGTGGTNSQVILNSGHVTASGNISASGTGSFSNLQIEQSGRLDFGNNFDQFIKGYDNLLNVDGDDQIALTADNSVYFTTPLVYNNSGGNGGQFSWTGSVTITGSGTSSGSLTVNEVTGSTYTGSFTGSFLGTSSYAVTASHALNAGGGSGFPHSGSAQITGSLGVTGSTTLHNANNSITSLALQVEGSGSVSGSNIFEVVGSAGTLFAVSDGLSGSLFSVNDVSGIPVLEVRSDDSVLMGNNTAPSFNTTVKVTTLSGSNNQLFTLPTSSYSGVFVDYTLTSESHARAGNMMAITIPGTQNAQFTDTTTSDIGSTGTVELSAEISESTIRFRGDSSGTSAWTFKAIIRAI